MDFETEKVCENFCNFACKPFSEPTTKMQMKTLALLSTNILKQHLSLTYWYAAMISVSLQCFYVINSISCLQ